MVATLELKPGLVVTVDDEDAHLLARPGWRALRNHRTWYAVRTVFLEPEGLRSIEAMHRLILPGAPMVDHVDRDGLNCRRENLRRCETPALNAANSEREKRSVTGLRGVYPCSTGDGFRAQICVNYRTIHLGVRREPEAAARLYDAAAYEHFGEFARLNFPVQEPGYA